MKSREILMLNGWRSKNRLWHSCIIRIASLAVAALRETAAKGAAQRSATLQNEKWNAGRDYEVALADQRMTATQEQFALWRNLTPQLLDMTLEHQKATQTSKYYYDLTYEAIRDSLCYGHITDAQYELAIRELQDQVFGPQKIRDNEHSRNWLLAYQSYQLAMQTTQGRFEKSTARLYETYENSLTDALEVYWTDSVNVGAMLETSLAALTNQYVTSLNLASDSYSDSVLTAGQTFDNASLTAAETRVEADDSADSNWLENVMSGYITAANSAYTSVTGAVGSWLTSNLTAASNWFNTEKTNSASLITDLLTDAVAGITAGMSQSLGLVNGVLGAVGGYVDSLNASATEIDEQALQKSVELSLLEIEARVDYYKAVSAAEREAAETKSDTTIQQNIRKINYAAALLKHQRNVQLADILAQEHHDCYDISCHIPYGHGCSEFFDRTQLNFGESWNKKYFPDHYTNIDIDNSCAADAGVKHPYLHDSSCVEWNYYNPVGVQSINDQPSYVFGGYKGYNDSVCYVFIIGTITEVGPGLDGISAVANLKNLATEAKLAYNKAVARFDYVSAYTDLYGLADDEGWALAGQSLGDSISASTGLSGDLWDECSTINTSMFTDARSDETLAKLLSASQTGLQNDLALERATASNFGQYQINWRQQSSMTGSAKTQEVAWATNVKAARDAYFDALSGAVTDFDDTLTGAITDYADAMLEAQITRSQSHYDASQTRYNAMEAAMNAYTQSSFDAMKAAAKKYRDAAVKEIKDNAKDEKDIKEKEKDHYDNIANENEDELETITRPLEDELWSTKPLVIDPTDPDAIL